MTGIRCVVERITYQNPENGYSVIKVRIKDKPDLTAVVGNLVDVNVGSVLFIEGLWKTSKQYGTQFEAVRWEETMPATAFGIEKYLGSGLIKGIGPGFAKRIVSAFGTDTIEIIETSPARLLEIPGIGARRIAMICESWERQKEIKNIMIFLQGNGVSPAFASRIFKKYGSDSIKVVKENPYRLADDVWGIGFRTADTIAEKLGFSKDSSLRCQSGILYTLNQLADEGHVYAKEDQLIKKGAEILETDSSNIKKALDVMIESSLVISEESDKEKAVYLPAFFYAETGASNRLRELMENSTGIAEKETVDFDRLEKKTGFTYDEIQKQAILKATVSKVMILTGGPGTGKTTTILGIIRVLSSRGKKILLAAPTGRAAKRMTEATGLEARTIHRLLEFKPPEGYQRNADKPLEGDVLIVDESSMIDIVLMNSLLKAVPVSMQLIIVGDTDQLPSVGAGNVLKDMIDSGAFPVVKLTTIFRQALSSRIITNAHRIDRGEFPDISNSKGTDFFFIKEDDPEKATELITELVKTRLPSFTGYLPSDIQVLTPMQRSLCGATNLNQMLQEALNPSDEALHRSGHSFRKNDKVMQIRNNYDKQIFNGDIGIVSEINMQERTLKVDFDGQIIEYESGELDELVHAYAVTIHKSQGSEYPVVVIPILMQHYIMLQRNLLYTGITRAKKLLVLVGSLKAVGMAVRTESSSKRNTKLAERLQCRGTFKTAFSGVDITK